MVERFTTNDNKKWESKIINEKPKFLKKSQPILKEESKPFEKFENPAIKNIERILEEDNKT